MSDDQPEPTVPTEDENVGDVTYEHPDNPEPVNPDAEPAETAETADAPEE